MNKDESDQNAFSCIDENEARLKSAYHGRNVCGVCVS